jgi:hypothetical protein
MNPSQDAGAPPARPERPARLARQTSAPPPRPVRRGVHRRNLSDAPRSTKRPPPRPVRRSKSLRHSTANASLPARPTTQSMAPGNPSNDAVLGDASRAAAAFQARQGAQIGAAERTPTPAARRPRWVHDAEEAAKRCCVCKSAFWTMRRRHHCRVCGRCVCHDCSPRKLLIPVRLAARPPRESRRDQFRNRPGCSLCNERYTLMLREHHCRVCLQSVCGGCSKAQDAAWAGLVGLSFQPDTRVCDACRGGQPDGRGDAFFLDAETAGGNAWPSVGNASAGGSGAASRSRDEEVDGGSDSDATIRLKLFRACLECEKARRRSAL